MNLLFKYRWPLLLLVISFCVLSTKYFKTAVTPDNSVSIWFDKHDPALKAYYDFQKDFGNDRVIILAFKEDKDLINSTGLDKIKRLSSAITHVEGVKEVTSVLSAKDFRRIKEGKSTRVRFTSYFNDSSDLSATPEIHDAILSSPLIVNRYINKTGNMAMLVIHLDTLQAVENKMDIIIPGISQAAQTVLPADKIHLGGTDIITYGLNKLSERDFGLFTGLGFVLMFIITGIFYRRWLYIVLVSSVSLLTIWASLCIHGMLGFHLNIFTVISPPLIITLGIITILHIINEYENVLREESGLSTVQIAKKALRNVFKPGLFATLTTIIGFASLLTSPTEVLKEFGFLSSLGVLFLFVFSLLLCSIVLPFQKKVRPFRAKDTGYRLGLFSKHILKHSLRYAIVSVLAVVISIVGIYRINNDMNAIGYFPSDHQVIKDHRFIQENWGDYLQIDMTLKADGVANLRGEQIVRNIIAFDKEIALNPVVKNSFDFTALMHRFSTVAFRKDLSQILGDPFAAENFIDQFTRQIQAEGSGILVTGDFKKARMAFTGPLLTVRELEKNIQFIDTIAAKHFKGMASLVVCGYPALYIKIMNYAFDSMKSSLYSSFLMILIAMILLLKSFRTALIALAPNIFPVILLLGFLGFSQINLDLATCTVTAIVMGIAIDDTIYFLYKYQKAIASGRSVMESIESTHHYVGRVILISSLVMTAGFSIMLLASLKTVFYFGLLAIVSVVAAVAGDMVILPLLLRYTGKKKKYAKDHLR